LLERKVYLKLSSEIVRRRIHNDTAEAYAKAEIPCNAFCKPPIHCDLWYSQWESDPGIDEWRLHLNEYLGFKAVVVGVHRASHEAPMMPPKEYIAIGPKDMNLPLVAWLVFWRINGKDSTI
jgi:hypothetical protein